MESETLAFAIRNTAQGIQSLTDKDWNPVAGIRNPESGIQNPESRAWNLKSNTVLDFLIWGDARLGSLADGVGMRRILCVVFLCGCEDNMGNMRVVLRYYNATPSHIQKHFHSVLATGLHPLMLLDFIFLTI